MKDVKKCSLSGVAFTMDTDAYQTLSEYIESLRKSYGESKDGEEIVADIEARIAELILSTQSGDSVVEKPLIDNIIKQMGSASDISESSEEESAAQSAPRIPRRLYRDAENAKLGGVCAGLAKYFNTDPVWVRLIFMLPLLLTTVSGVIPGMWMASSMLGNMFGMFILGYIIMWFAVPVARSARQKLEMNGEPITAQSIRETTVAGSDADSTAKPVVANVVTVFGQIVLILLKIFAGVIVFGLILSACALIIGMIVVSIRGYGDMWDEKVSALVASLGIVVALIPVIMMIYVLMCLIASRKPGAKTILAMFILWLVSIVTCVTAAVYEYNEDKFEYRREHIISRSNSIVDGDTVRAERMIRENMDTEDVDISFDKSSGTFSVKTKEGSVDIRVDD